jgi:hypothetical protein
VSLQGTVQNRRFHRRAEVRHGRTEPWGEANALKSKVAVTPDVVVASAKPDGASPLWRPTLTVMAVFILGIGVRLWFIHVAPNNTTDAWARYLAAASWLRNPGRLPQATSADAWLPLHFWLLGIVLWMGKTELAARTFTAVLGSLTLLFCWGIWKRVFDQGVALFSTLLLALLGFHIAFSVTTGSEVPTIFFLAGGLYGWTRYAFEGGWRWLILCGVTFSTASLCRFESWLYLPVLTLALVDFSGPWAAVLSWRAWRRAFPFGVLASTGSVGWLAFSFLKWGDPLELPHRTAWLNIHFRPSVLRHSLAFRLATAPVSLLISLSPLVIALAALGLLCALANGSRVKRSLALLVLTLFAFNCWSAVRFEATQARYTLTYSWLLLPFAFDSLRWLAARWRQAARPVIWAGITGFFLLWQIGIIVGADRAPSSVADHLRVISPLVPLAREMRDLTNWLSANTSPHEAVVLDDFDWDSPTVLRFAHLDPSQTFQITPEHYTNSNLLKLQLDDFVRHRHPQLLVCSPYGPVGSLWGVNDRETLTDQALGFQLALKWRGEHWRVYEITYLNETQHFLPRQRRFAPRVSEIPLQLQNLASTRIAGATLRMSATLAGPRVSAGI